VQVENQFRESGSTASSSFLQHDSEFSGFTRLLTTAILEIDALMLVVDGR
jgi:hypothetical protein